MILKIMQDEGLLKSINMVKYAFLWYFNKFILRKKYFIRTINGYKMSLPTSDNGISRALAIVGIREKEHMFILNKVLKEDHNVLDIGANIGYYVLMEKQIIKNGKLFAIEPEPDNYHVLNTNIKLNKFKNIKTFQLAISNKEGMVKLYLSKLSNVHTLLPNDVMNKMSGNTIDVPAVRLTKFIQKENTKINLIRMDIEGFEVDVLKDLSQNLDDINCSPMILFEVHSAKYSAEYSLVEQLKTLAKKGYNFKYMASSRPQIFTKKGYSEIKSINTDGVKRHIFENIKFEDGIQLVQFCRTILLSREKI
jgi:FkbM family methyltransferase